MLALLTITKWQDSRDSGNRVCAMDLPAGRLFLLNTNCISDLMTRSGGSKFYYNENPFDARELDTYVESDNSVDTITEAFNATASCHYVTLPIHVNNNINRRTINTSIPMGYLMFVNAYNPAPADASWVTYIKDGFKRTEALVALSLNEILNLVSAPLLDYDGNIYYTTVIGGQEWIIESLRTTHYADGTAIPNVLGDIAWPADITGAYCWYNHDIANAPIYGALYNWYAVNNAHGLAYFTRGGVQEAGWRVPTVADWTALVTAIGGDYNVAGGYLKETGLTHWLAPNEGATDEYGFRGRGSGNRFVDSDLGDGFDSLHEYLDAWSVDEDPLDITHAFSIFLSNNTPYFVHWEHEKFGGMAVRCVRDV